MFVCDNINLVGFGDLKIQIDENGEFCTFNKFDINYEFYIVIKSLDSNLISNLMYHHCPIGYDFWKYNHSIYYIQDVINKIHPGICLEIYDKDKKQLIFSKKYRSFYKYKCVELQSKKFDITYPSYYTFFNDSYFLQNFTVKDGDVVYDLGANIGAFSIACSNYEVKKIYSFEPHPEIYDCLNYNLNVYGKNCTAYNRAISDKFKKVKFGNTETTVGSSINENGTFDVDVINLEQFVLENNLELPTYLKIDIEGSEYEFFENTSDNFFEKVHSIFFEFHNNNGTNVLKVVNRLLNLGFKMNHTEDAFDHSISHMNTVYFIR